MNYYLFQSKFFIVFVAIASMSFAAIPFMRNSLADTSDAYVRSQMNRIQAEMMFIDARHGAFSQACTHGPIGYIVSDVIREHGTHTACRTNKPQDSEMIVYTKLQSGEYYCVDSQGTSCQISYEPKNGFRCKDL